MSGQHFWPQFRHFSRHKYIDHFSEVSKAERLPCRRRICALTDSMTSEQVRAAARKYDTAQRFDYFLKILGGDRLHPKEFSQEIKTLRYCGRRMVCLSDTLRMIGYLYIQADTHRYIYALEACGYMYVGATKDPFARYVDHIISSQCSSVILVAAAIDNNVVPRMEVVDVTDEESAHGIEGFWIRYLSWKGHHVVNSMENNDEFARLLKDASSFKSVVAHRIIGYPAATFPALLVSSSAVPVQELAKRFIPPWLAQ